ncbi:uncharacterized protein CTRU02_205127 [Colletotrichum truncatum]|uniref:Integral membrane protein n=1 Tax=Colletotrichum truncatum TaxID=5467 RepID=A0ACC3Z337_COLTU|nr:uncharacterized protein CTRU02_06045 [Colletotrichum truncatum]KAF6793173.1 integral membrane protein [Colletotrichum truncatum]
MPLIGSGVPARTPPDGYVVDFNNPQREAVPEAFWVAGVGAFLSLLLMAQRLYTKAFLVGRLQWDDAFLIVAWLASIATITLGIHMFARGAAGVHIWEMPMERYHIFVVDIFLAATIYIICGSFSKVSLLIFYSRLSPQKWFRWSVWITLGVIASYSFGIFFALVFACDPIAMSWDVTITEGTCINRPSLYIATAVANIGSDILLFALPVPIVVKLQIPFRQKIGLFVIFAVGSLTVITSIIRVSLLPSMLNTTDETWTIAYVILWVIIEANLFIMCAAFPTLRKFFRHIAPKVIGESTYGKESKRGGTGSVPISRLTIGTNATRNRNEYSQFDRDNSGETFVMSRVGPSKLSETSASSCENDATWNGDDSSEKAIIRSNTIVQTKTVTVEYSSND